MLDRLMIEKSTILVHIAETELLHIANLVGATLTKSKYAIIPLSTSNRIIASPSSSDLFRICWWGSWIPLHGLENILSAAKLLKDRNFGFTLDLFGTPGDKAQEYQKMIDQLNLSCCVTIHQDKFFANKKLETYLASQCDLALGHFGGSDKARMLGVGNKVIDAFSMQLPVLTMQTEALGEFVNSDEIFTCDGTPEAIANAVIKISKNKDELTRISRNGFERYQETFSFDVVTKKFLDLLQGL